MRIFFQLRGLQPNFFLAHLIDVLKEDSSDRSTAANTLNSCFEEEDIENDEEDFSELDASISLSYHCESKEQPASIDSGVFSLPPYELCRTLYCSFHAGQPFKLFCSSCETAICGECAKAEHRGHRVVAMAEAVEKEKEELSRLISVAKDQVPALKAALQNVEAISNELSTKEATLKADINAAFDQLHEIIERRRTDTLQRLQKAHAEKQKTLGKQKDGR